MEEKKNNEHVKKIIKPKLTEEDLEEYNDFGSIVREEKLDLPLWNELQEITKKEIEGFCTIKNFDNVHLKLKTNTNKETIIFIEKERRIIYSII